MIRQATERSAQSSFVQTSPPPRCLVIEDNAFDQKRMERLLEETFHGMEISFAATMFNALQILENVPFDLMIVDYRLPDGDGIELLGHVQGSGLVNTQTPAILMTGEDTEDLRESGRAAGFCSIMTKHHLTAQRVGLSVSLALDTSDNR